MKRSTFRSAFFSPRVLIALLLCAAAAGLTSSGTLLALSQHELPGRVQRTLTLQERVWYQRAIEEVYWRHRIWPKENSNPKPSLDAVMSQAQLEKKVRDYLRNSQALADYRHRPITTEQLQAEMDRMAQNTRQPEVLQELFEALGNDAFVIAECLARPMLAERLLAHAELERVKQPSRTFDQTVAAGANYTLPRISGGACIEDTWTPTNLTGAPDVRVSHTAVWTGSEMIVWGGDRCGDFCFLNTGGRYNPSTDSWTATSTTNAPDARSGHTAVWTGSEMIIWGGEGEGFLALNTGGRYNPTTDSWTATSTTDAPDARSGHTAVWTGSEMIVWGGGPYLNTGGRYNPNTNSWTATSTTNAPAPRKSPTAVWTGTEMIVWGGIATNMFLNTGGKYNPSTDSWTATSTTNAPGRRFLHTAVWTGSEMIVWGGWNISTYYDTGGRYNPVSDSWTATDTTGAPFARAGHTAVWTGSNMIVWGGAFSNSGGRYYPDINRWVATSTTNAPSARSSHTAVWTGSEMVVWGGNRSIGQSNTGGRYCVPSGPPPTPTPSPPPTPTPSPTPVPTPCPGGCVVTNTNDTGHGSLRQALAVAHDGDRITFSVSGVIRLTSGGLVVVRNITILGPGANQLSIDGNQATFVFGVIPHRTVTISGLSITNGQYGIWNQQGTLSVSNCVLSGNSSAGLYNDASEESIGASMTVANSIISNNSGTGAMNVRSLPYPLSASMTSGRSSAQQSSPDGLCACMTITDSVVSNNAGNGIYNDAFNAFANGGAELTVVNSDISNNEGSGITNDAYEGGASATIVSTNVSDNLAGGIFSSAVSFASAPVTVTDSTISGNSTYGGIKATSCFFGCGGANVSVANSTISGNSAGDSGGGIYGSATVENSTISGNSAGTSGGGIYGGATVENSTVSGNSAGTSGGGIYGGATVVNSTISGNSGTSGGGIYNTSSLVVRNTILNAGASGENIFNDGGTVTSLGYNLSSDDGAGYLTGPGDKINTDPLLGPLQDNGGPTFTHALLPGSPAVDAGDPNFSPPPSNDQRGCPRVINGRIDIGSFERQPLGRSCVTPRPHPTPRPRPTPG